MSNPRRFVYNTGSKSTKNTTADPFLWPTGNASRINPSGGSDRSMPKIPKNDVDDFELCLEFDDDDDITSTMSEADLERLELEATKKLGLTQASGNTGGKKVESKNVVPMVVETKSINKKATFTPSREKSPHKVRGPNSSDASQSGWAKPVPSNAQFQQISAQLQEYKSKVQHLEGNLCEKDGELKILRGSLAKNRQENVEKSERIFQLQNRQTVEKNKREASLAKEVASLKTRLSFQEQELTEQSKRIQSQAKAFSVTSSVKRKAEVGAPSTSFDLDNSFTQSSSSKKMPRIAERINLVKPKPIPGCSTSKKATVKPNELHHNPPSQSNFAHYSESKEFQLVKKLLLSYSSGEVDNNPADTMSLLNLLKYPLKHLPEVLKAHSVNTCMEESSQFPLWQSQKLNVGPVGENSENSVEEILDLESGKYNLVTQGIFILLGLHERAMSKGICNSYKEVSPSLGVMHILVFLELYISSYLFTKQDEANSDDDDDNAHLVTGLLNESVKSENSDDLEMVIYALQILKSLIYAAPSLVKCVIDRTNPSVFQSDQDVIIIDDDDSEERHDEMENDAAMAGPSTQCTRIPGCSECYTQVPPEEWKVDVAEEEASEVAMGSFLSLLLPNLEKLIIPNSKDESLTVCYAALDVLIAVTSVCEKTENERIFPLLKRGCLDMLLAKDSGSTTIYSVMSLLRNFLPCKGIHRMLCSQTDNCILLKIYQCACEEDEEDAADVQWRRFLLEVVIFIKSIAFSHSDSIQFLLETDCQCSLEIVRCLVLILHDKVNFLLDLDPNVVTTHESLTMLRIGITLLVVLCTHDSYSADHKLDVEHYYIVLIYKVMTLYKKIKHIIPHLEALGVQDLLEMEQIDEIEWSLRSDDEDEEVMEIDGWEAEDEG